MILDIYQVDAFTDTLFGGNPAAVVPLETWLPEDTMQLLALENNLSETVFFVPGAPAAVDNNEAAHDFEIRWFTPEVCKVNYHRAWRKLRFCIEIFRTCNWCQ